MTTADKPLFIDRIDAAVDHVLDTVPGDIVLGMPLGIGKPNPFVNALYRRIKANPARRCASSPRCRWKSRSATATWSALPGAAGRAGVRRLPRPGLREATCAPTRCRPTSRCASSS
jgi:hypothetical protein